MMMHKSLPVLCNLCSLYLCFKLSPFLLFSTFALFPRVPIMLLPPLLVACLARVGITWELCKWRELFSNKNYSPRVENWAAAGGNYADLTGIELSD